MQRLPESSGSIGETQSSVSAHKQAAETCNSHRTCYGQSLPRSKCESQVQRILAGHEHRVGANDGRRIEVLAQDLPCFGGAQLAVDVTLRCALARTGEPHSRGADEDGTVLAQARHDKETTYPELISSGRCRLVVVAIETGGRWSDEAVGGIH